MLTANKTIEVPVSLSDGSVETRPAVIAPLTRGQRSQVLGHNEPGPMQDAAIRYGLAEVPGRADLVRKPLHGGGLHGGWSEEDLVQIEAHYSWFGWKALANAIINESVLSTTARKNSESPTP